MPLQPSPQSTASPQLPAAPTNKFHRNDCFNRNGIRESWQLSPDGIVVMVGQESYLLMFRGEAERRVGVGGTKSGLPMQIRTFDSGHYKVECPDTWKNHTHTKGNNAKKG